MRVEFYRHGLSDVDIQEACKTMRSVFLTTGPSSSRFEELLAQYTGLDHVVALNSCTAALHLALLACGVGPGDEVITCPMTFIATATAIHHTGATPVFVDCEDNTGLIDVKRVAAAVSERTRAIIPIHLYGAMADMRQLREIADQHSIYLIEDAAHCIEGERDGIRPGMLGDAVCYSFYATKNLTCGEGGALATNSRELAETARVLRTHGMSKDAADRYTGTYNHWDMIDLGWKYNPSDILSSLLIHQIPRLDGNWKRRESRWEHYAERISGTSGIELPHVHGKSAYHLFTIWVDENRRDAILRSLQMADIGVAVNYRAIHTLTWFQHHGGYTPCQFPNARRIGARTISLPFYPSISEAEIAYVCDSLLKSVACAE